MFEKLRNLNANADKVELRYKAVGREMLQGSPCLTENITPWYKIFFLTKMIFVLNNSSIVYNFHLSLIYVFIFIFVF